MNNLIKWLRKKKAEDTILTHILKLGLAIGQKSWVHAILSAILGIIIPIFFDNKNFILFSLCFIILILDIMYSYLCSSYQKIMYEKRKFASEILSDESSLLKSMLIEMENNNGWRNKIFKTVSDLVCEKLYQNFKEVFNCETRIAIEYTFNKNTRTSQSTKFVKMSGRRSHSRLTVKRPLKLEERKKYYSYKIFIRNNLGVNILTEKDLQNEKLWYRNPSNSTNVKKYIGIAVSIYDESEVKFILEIDFLDDFIFGENNDENDIKVFIEQYLMAYINIISISYILNLNNKREIPEV